MPRRGPGPSVKDPRRYESMREQGVSKEKAARIANTPAGQAGHRGGKAPAYEEWTQRELYEKARKVGIPRRSQMNKGQLIDALRHH